MTLFDRDLAANLAGHERAVGPPRPLPGQKQQIAGDAIRQIVRNRGRHGWQHEAEFLQTGFCTHSRFLLLKIFVRYSRMRRYAASSPMMPRRNNSTHSTKITPWITVTHCPTCAR